MIIFDRSSTITLKSTYLGFLIILVFVNIMAYLGSAESGISPVYTNILISLIAICVIITSKPTLIKIEYKEEQKLLILSTMSLTGKIAHSKIMINDLRCKVENFPGTRGAFSTYICFYDKKVLIDKYYVGSNKIESQYTSLIQKLDEILILYQEKEDSGYVPKVLITI
jgi:hypothetical protein